MAGLLEEPFYVWPWQAVERVEAERSILCDDRAANLRGGKLALFRRDLVGLALQLRQVDLLIGEREGQAACITATALGEEELDLLELLGVAGDKCDQPRKKSVGRRGQNFALSAKKMHDCSYEFMNGCVHARQRTTYVVRSSAMRGRVAAQLIFFLGAQLV